MSIDDNIWAKTAHEIVLIYHAKVLFGVCCLHNCSFLCV